MNRTEIVRVMQAAINKLDLGYCSREKAGQLVDEFVDNVLTQSLLVDDGLTLRGFGRFQVREYPGRTVPHPQGGQEVLEVQPYKAVTFKAAGGLKDQVNGRV
jgi:nucleoid DNA-binding protein